MDWISSKYFIEYIFQYLKTVKNQKAVIQNYTT